MNRFVERVLAGHRLGREDDLEQLLELDLEDLCQGADEIRRQLCGWDADLCALYNGRCGSCSEDCHFCAQSGHYHTQIRPHTFEPLEHILEAGRKTQAAGLRRFSLVTSGRGLHGEDLEWALEAYRALARECDLEVCASHGLQTVEEFRKMRQAGAVRCHANLETSRRFFPKVCSTHTYQDEVDNIHRAKQAGLQVCSGVILGMGESWEDRFDMALTLAGLEVDSIPLNMLSPIPGTPLAGAEPLGQDEVRRAVAIFRYLNPEACIRIAAGRSRFPDGGEILFRSGANAAITGGMLTTGGTGIREDIRMLTDLGYRL